MAACIHALNTPNPRALHAINTPFQIHQTDWNDWTSGIDNQSISGTSATGTLQRIEESDLEHQSESSISSRRQLPPGIGSRTDSGSTLATDADSRNDVIKARGLDTLRIPDDAKVETAVISTLKSGGIASGPRRKSTLVQRVQAGNSPGVTRRYVCMWRVCVGVVPPVQVFYFLESVV